MREHPTFSGAASKLTLYQNKNLGSCANQSTRSSDFVVFTLEDGQKHHRTTFWKVALICCQDSRLAPFTLTPASTDKTSRISHKWPRWQWCGLMCLSGLEAQLLLLLRLAWQLRPRCRGNHVSHPHDDYWPTGKVIHTYTYSHTNTHINIIWILRQVTGTAGNSTAGNTRALFQTCELSYGCVMSCTKTHVYKDRLCTPHNAPMDMYYLHLRQSGPKPFCAHKPSAETHRAHTRTEGSADRSCDYKKTAIQMYVLQCL